MTRGRLAGVFAAVVVAAVVGVVFAGRGAGSPVAAAATRTSQTSAHVAFSLTVESPKLGHALEVSGNGAVDETGADVTVTDAGAPAGFPSSLHAIVVQQAGDELAFVHATPMPSLSGGKGWVEVDLSKLASAHGIDLGSLAAGASALTPTQLLDLLRTAGATVTDLGPAAVDGASATHYRVVVDAAEIAQAAGIALPDAGNYATKTVPVDVWIGTDGLVHRIALSLHHGAGSATFTATLGDYGADVSITPPPSSDVLDVTSLLTGFSGIRSHS